MNFLWTTNYVKVIISKMESDICPECHKEFPIEDFMERVYCSQCQVKIAQHPQVLVKINDKQFHVDEKIQELIYLLNIVDCPTANSCQGNPDKDTIWVEFCSMEKLKELLIQIRRTDHDIFHKMMSYTWTFYMHDDDIEEDEDAINMGYSLRFPHHDLSRMVGVLREIQQKQKK